MGLLGSIGSFLFGGSKKTGEQSSSSTQTRTPYAPVIPYLDSYLGNTNNIYNNTPMFSDLEKAGYEVLNDISSNAEANNPAIDYNNRVLSGQYLTPDTNPYLADIAKRISGIAGSNSNSTFGGRGRTSGGLSAYYNGKAVGDSLTDMYGSVYESERGRQTSAANLAPQLEQARYLAPQSRISAGQNISARPFDLNQQRGGILSQIAGLGGTTTTQGTATQSSQSPGLFGQIVNSFTNKLFPGGSTGPW